MNELFSCDNCLKDNKYLCDYYSNNIVNTSLECNIDSSDEVSLLCLELCKNASLFMKDLGYEDIVSIFYLYQAMGELGAFSITDSIYFDSRPIDYKGLFYPSIITGRGCCRNLCDFLRILLNTFEKDYHSFIVRGHLSFESVRTFSNEDRTKKDELIKKLDYLKLFIPKKYGLLEYFIGNHGVLYVSDNNRTLLLDPTNNYVFNYLGKRNCPVVGSSGSFNITGAILNNRHLIGRDSTIDVMERSSSLLTEEELVNTFYEVVSFVQDNIDLIHDFKHENEGIINEAYKLMMERKSLHR